VDDHLSRIETRLTVWLQAHQGEGQAAVVARQQLVLRYHGAVYRYVLGMLHEPDAAEDLTQDFLLRLLRGDFRHFDPQRGRFRDFLKVALRHLVVDYWRQKKQRKEKEPQSLQPGQAEHATESPPEIDVDQAFIEKWKEELLARAWEALEKDQQESNQPYYFVLRLKTEQPDLRSAQLAIQVSAQFGKPVTGDSLRQLLHRARRRFAELLVDEVGRSIETAEPDQVAEELIDLGLMSYCRSAVSGAAVSITWHQPFPLKAQGNNSLGVTVKCHLTGITTSDQNVNITRNATSRGRTAWLIDFGAVASGNYKLTALGNDGSSYGPVAIRVTENIA
jgi:RNA polymerase sigma-70 factor (ECF subfamily)